MQGTCLGNWIEREFEDELLQLKDSHCGLTFHNPNWQPPKEIIKREEDGEFCDLERYQDFYKQSSDLPTEKHTIPVINGAYGVNSVERILESVGYQNSCIDYDKGIYLVERTIESLN